MAILERLKRILIRRNLTISSALAVLAVSTLIGVSLYDFVTTALAKDEQVQESTLKGELALFILALRDDDGSSLLDNVTDFASAKRELRAVALRKNFYTYFLTQENAKQVAAKGVNWEAPKACALDFIDQSTSTVTRSVRACFAVVPDEPSGRYIYFSISYPSNEIARHRAGLPLNKSSSVLLRLKGENTVAVRLVFQEPEFVRKRYPSQLRRFANVHEITAYSSDQVTAPMRQVRGQAFEKRSETLDGTGNNIVTLLGRIDAQLVFNSQSSIDEWVNGRFREFSASIEVSEMLPSKAQASTQIKVPFGAMGTAQQSLEQAYHTVVQSRANVELFEESPSKGIEPSIWSSSSSAMAERRTSGIDQDFSNRWVNYMINKFDYQRRTVEAEQFTQGSKPFRVKLTAEPVLIPDLAAKAFFGLLTALAAFLMIGAFWFISLNQLNMMTKRALRSARSPSLSEDMNIYAKKIDEIGSLGRAFEILIRRFRLRNSAIIQSARRQEAQRQARSQFADEQYKARHDVLRAIGHEIRSPLQSLLTRTTVDPVIRSDLERMGRAVEALYTATSVQEGLRDRRVSTKLADAAEFLQRLATNMNEQGVRVVYNGPEHGAAAMFDNIALDDALSNILENAQRFKVPDSAIAFDLEQNEVIVQLKISNIGPHIASEDLGVIFDYGFTTQPRTEHMGLGLFSSRVSVLRMGGTLSVSNTESGVMFTISLSRKTSDN